MDILLYTGSAWRTTKDSMMGKVQLPLSSIPQSLGKHMAWMEKPPKECKKCLFGRLEDGEMVSWMRSGIDLGWVGIMSAQP